ncbi:hypothetical protein ANN_15689 [Periplaneta americana]|uniref:Uncharacterized protein n=1 Tax=Periplaneta americana TaxID=6978 RepID=A0ABQ8SI19_PERAM|nr:hypothetical protein ANN_15689 [Periplaneta americana]
MSYRDKTVTAAVQNVDPIAGICHSVQRSNDILLPELSCEIVALNGCLLRDSYSGPCPCSPYNNSCSIFHARSPDLTPLDFFLWGYVKSLVYETPVETEEDLRARILAACDNVRTKPGLFQRTLCDDVVPTSKLGDTTLNTCCEYSTGLEEIGMGFIIGEDCRNKRNVWRKVKKRLKDIDRQITEGECRDKVALEIQWMIKTNWGIELDLYGGSREGRLGLIWFRLGAWRLYLRDLRRTEIALKRSGESYDKQRGFSGPRPKFVGDDDDDDDDDTINKKSRINRAPWMTNLLVSVFLYGCETWPLTLREEQRLRVFENKVLRKIFGAKRDEVTGEWRKLHYAEVHTLYSSPDIIRNIKSRRLRWAGHVARMGECRNAYRMFIVRSEGKRPFGRPRRRWEDNIKMNLREVGYDRDWINLAQDRDRWRAYVRAAMNLWVP